MFAHGIAAAHSGAQKPTRPNPGQWQRPRSVFQERFADDNSADAKVALKKWTQAT
jgi:hypothetical protein